MSWGPHVAKLGRFEKIGNKSVIMCRHRLRQKVTKTEKNNKLKQKVAHFDPRKGLLLIILEKTWGKRKVIKLIISKLQKLLTRELSIIYLNNTFSGETIEKVHILWMNQRQMTHLTQTMNLI